MLCKSPRLKKTGQGPLDLIVFPCGSCLPCKINYQRIWQHRLCLEWISNNPKNHSAWVTFTYDDEHLPDPPDVSKAHVQTIRERLSYELLRKATEQANNGELEKIPPKQNNEKYGVKEIKKIIKNPITFFGIKVFFVAEYGDKKGRPHYHALIFGLDGTDDWKRNNRSKSRSIAVREKLAKNIKTCKDDNALIRRTWNKGFVEIDSIQSGRGISYQLGYVTKKIHKAAIRTEGSACWIKDRSIRAEEFTVKSPAIGLRAIERIASKKKDYFDERQWPIRELSYRYLHEKTGQVREKKKPLGRYLTEKLHQKADKSHDLAVDKASRRFEMMSYREISGILDVPERMSADGESYRKKQAFFHNMKKRKESL